MLQVNISFISILLFLAPGTNTASAYGILSVSIFNTKGEALPGAQLLVEGIEIGDVSDHHGHLILSQIPPGEYFIKVSFIGHETARKKINIRADEKLELKIILSEKVSELDEVVVTGMSIVEETRQAPYHVNVLDAKPYQVQAIPVVSLLNQLSGVRVREEGGLGSPVNIMLNGIGGKGVRIFYDGIPVNLLGSGMALNNLPVNMIERIEVYKGVIPVKFGADALGGAINVVPKIKNNDYIDASLMYGSWNTHQSTLRLGKHLGSRRNVLYTWGAIIIIPEIIIG